MASGKIDADFTNFLDSMVSLDALDRMTRGLDDELKDSQEVMNEIKGMLNVLPLKDDNLNSEPDKNGLRHEDISNFLSTETPSLLMPDMNDHIFDADLDNVIATMKSYIEELKNTFTEVETETQPQSRAKHLEHLDLGQYASSMDQMCKWLSNLKLNKSDSVVNRSVGLESKLALLCDDVNMFTKMVQAKTTLSEANKNWSPTQEQSYALEYDNLINKLLSGINEVSYLLQNKD